MAVQMIFATFTMIILRLGDILRIGNEDEFLQVAEYRVSQSEVLRRHESKWSPK